MSPLCPSCALLAYAQSVGQIIGDVLKQLDDDRFIVKASSGPRYVVGCRNKLDKAALKPGTRVSLDMTTLTIMRKLPREVSAAFARFQWENHMFFAAPAPRATLSLGLS